MHIYDGRHPKTTYFENIDEGEMFYDPENEMFCMRIQECQWDDGNEPSNAVDLADGQLLFYEQRDEVVNVKGKVEIYE